MSLERRVLLKALGAKVSLTFHGSDRDHCTFVQLKSLGWVWFSRSFPPLQTSIHNFQSSRHRHHVSCPSLWTMLSPCLSATSLTTPSLAQFVFLRHFPASRSCSLQQRRVWMELWLKQRASLRTWKVEMPSSYNSSTTPPTLKPTGERILIFVRHCHCNGINTLSSPGCIALPRIWL